MFRKLRFAFRQLVTMSNILENLVEVYGDREVMCFASPLGYRRFPGRRLFNSDCILFTNLVAEALIRELDLKKGERVILHLSDERELLLLALAVIKAGGIVVPLNREMPWEEAREYAAGCLAGLAVVDEGQRPGIPGVDRWMMTGPREDVPAGFVSLDEAIDSSSGFFIPYTLKPNNVVGLFPSFRSGDKPRPVMMTNQGFLATQRIAAFALPLAPGKLAYLDLPLCRAMGFASAVVGLCAGAGLYIPDGGTEGLASSISRSGCDAFMGTPSSYSALLGEGTGINALSEVRLWSNAFTGLPHIYNDIPGLSNSSRPGPLKLPAAYAGFYGIPETGILTLSPAISGLRLPRGCLGMVLPPTRVKIADERGRGVPRGEKGELLVKGPNVTPGYWNDMEETFRLRSGSWLHTGIPSRRGRFLIYAGEEKVETGF
ncbi:MAG: AMP-binding protein [Actinomycetota bacterium]